MTKKFTMIGIAILVTLVASGYTLVATPVFAQEETVKLFGHDLKCYANLPPKGEAGKKGCGIPEFVGFLRFLITWLLRFAIPLAIAFIVYGGIVIMTAGGSEEKVKKGKAVITAAVVGLVVGLASWLIVTLFNFILAPGSQIK